VVSQSLNVMVSQPPNVIVTILTAVEEGSRIPARQHQPRTPPVPHRQRLSFYLGRCGGAL